ncbi:MAG: hypothetical protein IPK31_11585 [Chitinophagaceae bacterium]|nr:hypothetical protein [Chitinophagaceae bacterium]
MRLGLGLMFLMIGLFGILFYLSGMHGHLTFRPHMLQDWIIWGIVTVSFIAGFYFILKGIKKLNQKD